MHHVWKYTLVKLIETTNEYKLSSESFLF